MKLIVGLGNPGKLYKDTRHNIGFMAIDNFADSHFLTFKSKMQGLYAEFIYNNEKIVFLKPQSYMNLSGAVVREYKNYFNVPLEDIFVIYDDINFDLGTFKLKKDGSAAGHKGIENIIKNLKSENVKRLKMGISKNRGEIKKYVTGKFGLFEKNKLKSVIDLSAQIMEDYYKMDFEKLMSKYNGLSK